jgi:hypothetical protein
MKTRKVLALVRYSVVNELPREFFAHEIPILQNQTGGYPVTVVDDNLGEGPDMSARDVLVSLRKTYGKSATEGGSSVIDEVFPDGSRDIEAFYRGEYEVPNLLAVDEVLDDGDVFGPATARAVLEGAKATPEMAREDIMARLTKLEVPFSANTPTKHLVKLLEASVESDE